LRTNNKKWRQEVELEPEDKILASRVRNLEDRINNLEAELEELRSKIGLNEVNKIEENDRDITKLKDQTVVNRKK
jgi:TolA-binding protein